MQSRCARRPSLLCLITSVLFFGIFLTALNVWELRRLQLEHFSSAHNGLSAEADQSPGSGRPIVWVKAKNPDSGYLDHVFKVFHRIGYMRGSQDSKWDVAWHHDYPFMVEEFRPIFLNLQPHQKINHIPGSGFYTSKVNLATTNVSGIPPAFKLPGGKDEFLKLASAQPDTFWVQKNNNHRGIVIKKVSEVDLNQEESFVQEYISKPLLVDGRKFDIGVYVVITSILPLRVFVYEGDFLLRFCPQNYHPFDPKIVDKYVVGDDYTPTWNIESLAKYYSDGGHRESLGAYLKTKFKDPEILWEKIRNTIREVFMAKATDIRPLLHKYPNGGRNFFELSRFDFVIDENLNPYLMEANMSPNLGSGHFPQNKLIYEQVLWNLLSLVGAARHVHSDSLKSASTDEMSMQVSDQDIQVFHSECLGVECKTCEELKCKLCHKCLTPEHRQMLKDTFLEHSNRLSMRRVVPEPHSKDYWLHGDKYGTYIKTFATLEDQLLVTWFKEKCLMDSSWCQ